MKTYKAIVWVGDEPGIRVAVDAEDAAEAGAKLRAEYGDEAITSAWNEEDSHRPR